MNVITLPDKDTIITFVEGKPSVTIGSLFDLSGDIPGTVNWQVWTEGPMYFRREDTDITITGTASAYDFAVHEPTAGFTQIDYAMKELEKAAKEGNEQAFLDVKNTIDWQKRSADDLITAIQLALEAGAHLAARKLAMEGSDWYPEHNELRKYAHILAPPKVTRSERLTNPELKANRDWLMTHSDAFRGKWVALHNGKLLTSADSLESLSAQIGDKKDLHLTKVF